MPLRIADQVEQTVCARARDVGRDPDEFASELLQGAVRRYRRKLATLRDAVGAGETSADAPPGAFNRVRVRFGLPPRQ